MLDIVDRVIGLSLARAALLPLLYCKTNRSQESAMLDMIDDMVIARTSDDEKSQTSEGTIATTGIRQRQAGVRASGQFRDDGRRLGDCDAQPRWQGAWLNLPHVMAGRLDDLNDFPEDMPGGKDYAPTSCHSLLSSGQ